MKNNKIYTQEDWAKDGSLNPKIGQYIDEDVFYELLGAMPPTTYKRNCFQPGEAYSHQNGKALYMTFVNENGLWKYVGLCFEGDNTPRVEGWDENYFTENKKYDNIIENAVKYSINEAFSDLYQPEHFDNDIEEDEENDFSECIDPWTLSDVLKKHGWSYSDFSEWGDKTGKEYVRYIIDKDRHDASDVQTVFKAIKDASECPEGIHFSQGQYNYAPEIKKFAIFVEVIAPNIDKHFAVEENKKNNKKITIKESELRDIVENVVRKQLVREDAYNDAYDSLVKQSTLKKIAVNFVNKAGYKTWKDDNENYFTFNAEVSSMKDEEIIVNGLRKALKVKPEYVGELRGNYETRLGGSDAYVTIYLPSWNKCNLNL